MDLGDDVDLDYFDRRDLGRLRRRLRNAVQSFRRERELYLELVLSYIDVRFEKLHFILRPVKYLARRHFRTQTRSMTKRESVTKQGWPEGAKANCLALPKFQRCRLLFGQILFKMMKHVDEQSDSQKADCASCESASTLVPQVEDVIRNSERGPGAFQSSTAACTELLPPWAATLQWWWRCRISKWAIRCGFRSAFRFESVHDEKAIWKCNSSNDVLLKCPYTSHFFFLIYAKWVPRC